MRHDLLGFSSRRRSTSSIPGVVWRWDVAIAIAFAIVYLVWGSTYLVIRIGVQELPPFLFAGVRFVAAGALLTLAALAQNQPLPKAKREWWTVAVVGVCMLATANVLVVWGEQWLASNQAALLVATAALWLAGFGALGRKGHALPARTLLGLILGFFGAAWMLRPERPFVLDEFWAQLAVLASAVAWSAGSIYAKRRHPVTPPLMSAAMQSLVAGVFLCGIGLALGESARWQWTPAGTWSLVYLTLFGSCLAYAAYIFLLHNVSPAALGTYAYVNPAVAVVLGWLVLDETLTTPEILGMVVILAGVVLVTLGQSRRPVA